MVPQQRWPCSPCTGADQDRDILETELELCFLNGVTMV